MHQKHLPYIYSSYPKWKETNSRREYGFRTRNTLNNSLLVLACQLAFLDNVMLRRELFSLEVPVQHVLHSSSISQLQKKFPISHFEFQEPEIFFEKERSRNLNIPEHQLWCQKCEGSQLGLACIAMDDPWELAEDTKHPHCNLIKFRNYEVFYQSLVLFSIICIK